MPDPNDRSLVPLKVVVGGEGGVGWLGMGELGSGGLGMRRVSG